MLTWLFAATTAFIIGYGLYWLTWRALTLFEAGKTEADHCVVCHLAYPHLRQCDSCGNSVCDEHAVSHSMGIDTELLTAEGSGLRLYARDRRLMPGTWCFNCDIKRLLGILLGIIGGDTCFIFLMRHLLFA